MPQKEFVNASQPIALQVNLSGCAQFDLPPKVCQAVQATNWLALRNCYDRSPFRKPRTEIAAIDRLMECCRRTYTHDCHPCVLDLRAGEGIRVYEYAASVVDRRQYAIPAGPDDGTSPAELGHASVKLTCCVNLLGEHPQICREHNDAKIMDAS